MVSSVSTYSEMQEESADAGKLPRAVYLIAQEIKIAKSLAANDPKRRMRQLRKLRKWLSIRSNSSFPFTEDDFLRIWKGLFYCMWMSDKPLVQESLAEDLGSLLYCFSNVRTSTHFFGAFLQTMCLEWFGIDQWRINKFLMLVRRMLRHMLQILSIAKWKREGIFDFTEQLSTTVLSWKDVDGLKLHIVDIYLEEVAKVADGNIGADSVALLVKPFIFFLAKQKDIKLLRSTIDNIFFHLLWQSDKGRDYSEKFDAWKKMGFPVKSIDELEKVEDSEAEDESGDESGEENDKKGEKNLDPRAGRVDVFVPEIPVDVDPLIRELESLLFKDITNTKSRRFIRDIIEKYKIFKSGEFPLGIKKMPCYNAKPLNIGGTIHNIEKLENSLYSTTRKLKKLSKKKRKRLLSNLNFDGIDVDENNMDDIIEKVIPPPQKKMKIVTGKNEWKEEDIKIANKGKENKSHDRLDCSKKNKSDQVKHLTQKNTLKRNKINEKVLNFDENEESASEHTDSDDDKNISNKSNNNNSINKNGTLKSSSDIKSEWEKSLEEGEVEYFLPSRKIKLQSANKDLSVAAMTSRDHKNLVINPFAKKHQHHSILKTPKSVLLGKSTKRIGASSSTTSATISTAEKKVKIMLHKNVSQKPSEYIKQVRSSPQLPYDSDKKPAKSLLKPNLTPSPINPFYKKKIGLKFNDTF